MHYKVEIAVRKDGAGEWLACTTEQSGAVARGYFEVGKGDREEVVRWLESAIVADYPQHSFDFIHTEG